MRTVAMVILSTVIIGFVGCALWWNAARVEAWASDVQHERKLEQQRQQVKHAEAFLRKGLEELDAQIEHLENLEYEHRVSSEECRLMASKQQTAWVEAEQLTLEFASRQESSKGQPFDFYGRTYDATLAEAQFDRHSRDVLARRQALDELQYDEVSHRRAADYSAKAVQTLREAREKAQREGDRLLVDRDVADARALAQALSSPTASKSARQLDSSLASTINLLREYLNRRNAEIVTQQPSGAATVDETCQRKAALAKDEELNKTKADLRQRAKRGQL